MSVQEDASENATLTANNIQQLMTVNKALLDAVIDIKQLLQNQRQVAYPGNLPAAGTTTFATDLLDIGYFIRCCGGRLVWTSDPEEHLEFDWATRSLKFMWPNMTVLTDGRSGRKYP